MMRIESELYYVDDEETLRTIMVSKCVRDETSGGDGDGRKGVEKRHHMHKAKSYYGG